MTEDVCGQEKPTITSRILHLRHQYNQIFSDPQEAGILFVGKEEMVELRMMQSYVGAAPVNAPKDGRETVCGLKIVPVGLKSYLAVCAKLLEEKQNANQATEG